jgi:hypothetical protein
VKRILRNLVLAFIIGLGFLGIVAFATTWGIPFAYDNPASSCPYWGPSFWCYSYNPLIVGLDYLFWTGIAFLLVSAADRVSARWGNEYREVKYDERAGLKFFTALILFGVAILSVMLGVTNQAALVSANQAAEVLAWYIGSIVLAIFGVIVLKLPASNRGQNGK